MVSFGHLNANTSRMGPTILIASRQRFSFLDQARRGLRQRGAEEPGVDAGQLDRFVAIELDDGADIRGVAISITVAG